MWIKRQGEKGRKLAGEILEFLALSLLISVFVFCFLYFTASSIADTYLMGRGIVLNEERSAVFGVWLVSICQMCIRDSPCGKDYTFWGKGVSQGHSDAIRRIEGVVDARQYTIPVEEALQSVRSGQNPDLTTRQKHTRECFVVAEEGADKARIEEEIKTMPNYFADYDTTVHFISMEELKANHSGIPHGGFVIRTGKTGWEEEYGNVIEYSLKLDSNPAFTSSVLVLSLIHIFQAEILNAPLFGVDINLFHAAVFNAECIIHLFIDAVAFQRAGRNLLSGIGGSDIRAAGNMRIDQSVKIKVEGDIGI